MTVAIPDEPDAYFREFFPEQFRLHRKRFPRGDSAAATRYCMTGEGAWCFRFAGDELVVEAGGGEDVGLQLESARADFHALFVARTRDEVRRGGGLSEGSQVALKPLFLTAQKRAVCESTSRSLALDLVHDRATHRLLVTPGAGAPTAPGATVRMKIDDYLAIQTGKRNPTTLFMMGKLRVKGDLAHALKLNPLLA